MLLRIHFLQQRFSLSDERVEDSFHAFQVSWAYAGIDLGANHIPDATNVLRLRHLLLAHVLPTGLLATINSVLEAKGLPLRRVTATDVTITRAPASTKNRMGTRDPETNQTRKVNQWFSLMKAQIGTDVASGLVHTDAVVGTPANTHDRTAAGDLQDGGETDIRADAG